MGVTIRIIDADAAEERLLAAPESCAAGATHNVGGHALVRISRPYIGGGTAGAATPWCRTRGDEGGMARP
jgi:hypothetical protein